MGRTLKKSQCPSKCPNCGEAVAIAQRKARDRQWGLSIWFWGWACHGAAVHALRDCYGEALRSYLDNPLWNFVRKDRGEEVWTGGVMQLPITVKGKPYGPK